MLKILETRLQHYGKHELPDVKLVLEKAEEPEIKLQHLLDHLKSKRVAEKKSTSALLTTLRPLTVWITTNCGKFLKICEYHTT